MKGKHIHVNRKVSPWKGFLLMFLSVTQGLDMIDLIKAIQFR